MKKNKLINLLFVLFTITINAQMAIGKTAVEGSSILDFVETGNTKGIILPALSSIPATPTNGFLGFYRGDARIYMYQNSIWVPLTEGNGSTSTLINNSSAETGNGVVMGAATSTAAGVLVLQSSNLALTLPKIISPHLNVKSPYPGMICYDTTSNTIAVFDGAYWNFWK
ncbi:MAG: hypothetical protein DI529_10460 [Chryseobacterium sp.]|nr:MAG: hypothetical protein DI529_10460 [Chryseobacterium sp.]